MWFPTPRGTSLSVRHLVEPVTVVGSMATCAEVDASFRRRWTSSSVLPPPTGGRRREPVLSP